MEFDFENSKHAAVLIMHKLKYTTLPNDERISRILNTRPDALRGKSIVTQTISCAAYMMYLADTSKSSMLKSTFTLSTLEVGKRKITVTLSSNPPQIAPTTNAGESVGFTWSLEGFSGHLHSGGNPKATYVPLYKLQSHSLNFGEQNFGKR